MPNAKIYIDHAVWTRHAEDIVALLPQFRELLCRELRVGPDACQIVAVPVYGLGDQPHVNVELHILPAPERTGAVLTALGEALRRLLADVVTEKTAVRITTLDPQTYIALKS
ncbi:hypothetical protein ACFFP0_05390 [Rhizobium puerariae]|uniref:Isomerase n=1 Tax=Rhizobium puerariae TaxID=1585791 RepID=A0ABV6ACB7_9HYPH